MTSPEDEDHKRKAQKHKEVFEKKLAEATKEKGLLIVNTGNGKGKTTAAFGMGLRILGHGMNLGVVQFIKGALQTAERDVLANHDHCEFYTIGDGYTWNTQDRAADIATSEKAWAVAESMLTNPKFKMIILDELNIVLKHGYLDAEKVLEAFRKRPADMHVVVTGRHASEALIEEADLVSEINSVKHPYREQGIKAQKGVEF